MSNKSKPQEWFYLQNDTWNGPFKTSGLKELVKKGIVDPSTLLRIGIAGVPIKAHQVKSLFPNYQGNKQLPPYFVSAKNPTVFKFNNALIGGGVLLLFALGILIFSLFRSNEYLPQTKSDKNIPQISLADNLSSIEKTMALIPPGIFMMGDLSSRLQVTLARPFYLGKYEVTQEQWERVMGSNPSRTNGAKLPVTDVSWEDCQEFIRKLNANTKGGYRLPTEAEWEYACRAGTTTAYSYGDSLTKSDANYGDGAGGDIKAVGSYRANEFGLYDMHGNADEWCNDWYGSLQDGEVTDPIGPVTGVNRVSRGGAFGFNETLVCSFSRSVSSPTTRGRYKGFRLAKTMNSEDLLNPNIKAFLLKLKQEEEAKAKKMEAVKLKQEEEAKAKQMELMNLKQEEEAKAKKMEAVTSTYKKEEVADLGKGIKIEMVLISEGKFKMGSPASEKGRTSEEPQYEATISKPYYIGKYEVTQEQWEAVMGNNPSETAGAKLPVTNVSWYDCKDFTRKMNSMTDGGYRLPTEAEWEYACRAGTTTAYSFGDSITNSDANFLGSIIKPVGSYPPNPFGLYDMHGNVWEWCEDWFGYYPSGAVIDPKGPGTGESHVLRGGAFFSPISLVRSAGRSGSVPAKKRDSSGFRLARKADIKSTVEPTAPKLDPAAVVPSTEAKEIQKSVAMRLQKEVKEKEDLDKRVKLDLVLIPTGRFRMEGTEKDHEVTLTKPFYLGKYEVTQEQWLEVMGKNPSIIKGAKLPVTPISWEECQEFIKKLNAKTNGGYRLPTEAEWEYACRAGTTTAYSFGDNITPKNANYDESNIRKPVKVGSYKPNAFGLYDMHGNVWEWCEDWYGDYSEGALTDPKGPGVGEFRVLRGGSSGTNAFNSRSSFRFGLTPVDQSSVSSGFRLAWSK